MLSPRYFAVIVLVPVELNRITHVPVPEALSVMEQIVLDPVNVTFTLPVGDDPLTLTLTLTLALTRDGSGLSAVIVVVVVIGVEGIRSTPHKLNGDLELCGLLSVNLVKSLALLFVSWQLSKNGPPNVAPSLRS